ncbi:MAG: flagellar basal body-associated FliL family protein, partial [Nocardioides sp.]
MKTDTAPPATEAGADGGKKPRSRKKLLIVGGVVLALVLGAGYWFVLRPSGPTAPQPGQIMTLESTQINLAGGH